LSDDIPNLCQGCTLEKDCCETMSGLWTTDEEYKPVFKGHEDKLLVKRSNNIVFLYMKENEPCPLWDGQCTIYKDRPIDCRLFPYKMTNIIQYGGKIKITFNNIANCPKRNELVTEEEAAALILQWGKMAFGEDANIVVHNERTWFQRWFTVFESYLSRPRLIVGGE
jgi:Fe-S-cluster containining protein